MPTKWTEHTEYDNEDEVNTGMKVPSNDMHRL